jgi:hypothetical protein
MEIRLKILTAGLLLLLQTQTCKKEALNDVPPCILEKIQQIKNEKIANPPASVWQYEYNGQTVYYIPAVCCDIPSQLLDANCNLICSPDGGFTGKGDGKCTDFAQKRTKEKLIWKDTRSN